MNFLNKNPLTSINILMAACLFGGLTGACVLLLSWPPSQELEAFRNTPDFVTWLFIVCILFSAIPFAFIHGLLALLHLKKKLASKNFLNIIWQLLLLIVIFSVPFLFFQAFGPVFRPGEILTLDVRTNIITILCGISVLPSILGLFSLSSLASKIRVDGESFLAEYFLLKNYLSSLIFSVSIIIGLGTLATGGLQRALQNYADAGFTSSPFPPVLTIVYGAYFSFILVILYFPSEVMLPKKGKLYILQHIEIPPLSSKDWSECHEKRLKAEEWLNIMKHPLSNLSSNLVILVPLLGGLISYLIPQS
ncbi:MULTISPECIES: hypothetical protein [Cyanophyceae]|uniref:Uncharacterized protein n=1 Tax=Leptolyngbya subtilissima DQ-A4 TaxID=2933933 RepID=A0ABV0KCA8_9CYAN|nr:hypothetical protein [Nodosilinea sp. FACHB-141]MBD2110867.1 hypothetical protein [Nodosilinea sp. FACHB-141]